jgi:hypothetical protein
MLDMRCNPMMLSFNSASKQWITRTPKRITITIPHYTLEALVKRSDEEGRSMSNLAAFILEQGLKD